jgi:SAM-dependent methyltransferase
MDTDDVARDGSPVEIYLALPAEPDLSRLRTVIPPSATVLDLGCGVGRLANPLAAAGHLVVAVDDSAAMLAHVHGPETVLGDIWSVRLGRRFDVVLALSHLINDADRARRSKLLHVCRRHVADGGIVVVQRYAPDGKPVDRESAVGDITVRLHSVVEHADGSFDAVVTYGLGGRAWSQAFTSVVVDDAELESLALENDLQVRGTIAGRPELVVLAARAGSGG